MDSLNVFEKKQLPPQGPRRSPLLTAFIGHLLPGIGHVYVGKTRFGFLLLAANVGLGGIAAGLLETEQYHLWWVFLRAATLTYLFSVLDAAFLATELPDGRVNPRTTRPRVAALLNLTTYGVGYWLLDRRPFAAVAWAFGILAHLWAGSLHIGFLLGAEAVLALSAWHAWKCARDDNAPRRRPGLGERVEIVRDTTPGWVMPTLGTFAVLSLLFTAVAASGYRIVMESLEVDQSTALAVEPYYRNSAYGVSLEMNAPGWNFRDAAPNEFVTASHVAEDVSARLSVFPRVPLFLKSERVAREVIDKSLLFGYALTPTEGEPVKLGKLNGYQLMAQGTYAGQEPREVFVLAVEKGFQSYVLWFEWEPGHAGFAQTELAYLLGTLTIADQTNGLGPEAETLAR